MNKIVGGVILALVAIIGLQQLKSCRAKDAASDRAFRADSLAAALDTTRALHGAALAAVQRVYGDSVRAVERRTVQVQPKRDTLDRVLARERLSNQVLQAQVEALIAFNTLGSAVTEDTITDERSATFNIRQEPYTVMAAVTLPGIGREARMDSLRIALDSARLYIRQQCGEPVNGVRPATLLVTHPGWLRVRIDTTMQAPGACNPPAPRRWWQGRLSVGPGAFLYRDPDTRQVRGALGVGVQFSVWRWP